MIADDVFGPMWTRLWPGHMAAMFATGESAARAWWYTPKRGGCQGRRHSARVESGKHSSGVPPWSTQSHKQNRGREVAGHTGRADFVSRRERFQADQGNGEIRQTEARIPYLLNILSSLIPEPALHASKLTRHGATGFVGGVARSPKRSCRAATPSHHRPRRQRYALLEKLGAARPPPHGEPHRLSSSFTRPRSARCRDPCGAKVANGAKSKSTQVKSGPRLCSMP